ncbi:MAG: hypothetical protein KTR31_25810 [Myxococcales bacterium]|nr:hypothetical protein [Myxococcales bacterium]
MWETDRPDGLETLAPGIHLQRVAPGEGPLVAEDDEIWFDARTSRQRSATTAGRVSQLHIPEWRTVAQHLRPREVARVFLDETRPELHDETVFDVGVSHRFPPEPGPFWQGAEPTADAGSVERFVGRRATEPQTDTYGRFVRYEGGTRRPTLADTFLPRPLGERAPFVDHLRELTPGSRVRIHTERAIYDVIVDGRGEPPSSEPLVLGDWQEERQQLFVREDGYAEIWDGLQGYSGLFSAGAHAQVKLCDAPDLDSVFAISDGVLTWEGGELTLDATFDADVLDAAKAMSPNASGGSRSRPSLGGGDFDFDFDFD